MTDRQENNIIDSERLYAGIDAGSVSLNCIVINNKKEIVFEAPYGRHIGKVDEDGYLYFVARKDDIIKSRGEKVSPKEIEHVIYDLPQVLEVAIVGVDDEIVGQAIKAFIVLKDEMPLTRREVIAHCSRNLENFMVPKYVEFVPELPKTTSGKIRKKDLMRDRDSQAE